MSLPTINIEPAIVFNYVSLDASVAEQAKAAASRIRDRIDRSIIETGRDLLAVKAGLDHGQFGEWIKAEFGWTDRTARNLMSAAELADAKSEIVSVLPATAIYKLAAPSTPETVMGIASASDTAALALAASRLEEVEICTAVIEDGGRTFVSSAEYDGEGRVTSQQIKGHPAVAQRSEAMRHAQSLLAEFGLTPAARAKVSVNRKPEANPFKALLG